MIAEIAAVLAAMQVIPWGCAALLIALLILDSDSIIAIIVFVAPKNVEHTVEKMRAGATIHFADLANVCRHYFGDHRTSGSHHIYKTPWLGNPRINIQNDKGKAKAYQVRQVLEAIDKLAEMALVKAKAAAKDKPKKK